ncbi:MAG TPA: acetoacetate decarboxylase family protein [Pseudonocardia sp.]|jgi:ribosomal protein S18 acetylase RimI-like enzyme|nr:acetoacetate decarboxylase family protein [Pseudonocardia sp.]
MATRRDDGTWEIRGRTVGFPVRIGSASAACATYLVPVRRVRPFTGGTGLQPVTVAGRVPVFLLLVEYRVNDLGAYDEVGLAFLVRHRGRIGTYVHQLPVTETLTMEAGRALWGLPKWLARAALAIDRGDAGCRLDVEGRHVLTVALRAARWPLPVRVTGPLTVLAPRAGSILASAVRMRARGVRLGFGRALLEAGDGHPMADDLRALGLPGARPLVTTVVDDLAFEMDAAVERAP